MDRSCQLQYLGAFTVAGILGEGPSGAGPSWILPLWQKTFENKNQITVKNCWGIMGHPDKFLGRWDSRGLYLAGFEVEPEYIPPSGWTKWNIPSQTYLSVDCTQTAYGNLFEQMIQFYLPHHQLEMTGAAYERYPEPGNPERVELWFPINSGVRFCQSCGMPLRENQTLGSEGDGSVNYDYCTYCYQKGKFTQNLTMNEMIEINLAFNRKTGELGEEAQARKAMEQWFPTLKRWKNS